jgi:uncharacterized protein YigE (DUF2233 family)
MNHRIAAFTALYVFLGVTACRQPDAAPTAVPGQGPGGVTRIAPTLMSPSPLTRPSSTSMSTWQPLRDGIEYVQRRERVAETDDWVTVVRVDLTKAKLRVYYAPDSPRSVRSWYDTINPDMVINAGFFTEQNKATGIVISNGKRYGQTYKGFGGMFSLRDGKPQLQWLAKMPYTQDDHVTQAIQSFPMLVLNGTLVEGIPDDGTRNRRSFIAIDQNGRLLLGTCQSPIWTMGDLAHYLDKNALLNITSALNLDGGASSGIWMRGVPDALLMDSLDVVPTVIAINGQ